VAAAASSVGGTGTLLPKYALYGSSCSECTSCVWGAGGGTPRRTLVAVTPTNFALTLRRPEGRSAATAAGGAEGVAASSPASDPCADAVAMGGSVTSDDDMAAPLEQREDCGWMPMDAPFTVGLVARAQLYGPMSPLVQRSGCTAVVPLLRAAVVSVASGQATRPPIDHRTSVTRESADHCARAPSSSPDSLVATVRCMLAHACM